MSNAIKQLKEMYDAKGWNLDSDLKEYFDKHYIYSSPDCIILAQLHDTHWYIHAAVGRGWVKFFINIMPEFRPYVSWARGLRNKELKFYKTERLQRYATSSS
jgi:hypothetical protein